MKQHLGNAHLSRAYSSLSFLVLFASSFRPHQPAVTTITCEHGRIYDALPRDTNGSVGYQYALQYHWHARTEYSGTPYHYRWLRRLILWPEKLYHLSEQGQMHMVARRIYDT
jgi:hypothetical protein